MHLSRIDERISAHLDGVAAAGDYGFGLVREALGSPERGEVFLAAVRALEDRRIEFLADLFALVEAAAPEQLAGLVSAFGWVSPQALNGVVRDLLACQSPFFRRIGLTACRLHGVDPGDLLSQAIVSADNRLRACALRCSGAVGRRDLLPALAIALDDDDLECRFRAAQSSVLLGGGQGAATAELGRVAIQPGQFRDQALGLAAMVANPNDERELLSQIAVQRDLRLLIRAIGCAGSIEHLAWLIGLMSDDSLTRCAGESFSLIAGTDLAGLDLERKPPEGLRSGPSDDAGDDDVSMDEDDGLPWPDQAKVGTWWSENSGRFQQGVRYLLGAPPTPDHCLRILKNGGQRQRIVAAHHLCFQRAGRSLFNCAAPAWRQKRLLAAMT